MEDIDPHLGAQDNSVAAEEAQTSPTLHTDTDPPSDEVEETPHNIDDDDAAPAGCGELSARCGSGGGYDADFEPYEGMEFDSEEAAKMFYGAYARRVGFRIRISRYTRSRRDNSIISRRIVCSKEGFREDRPVQGGTFSAERRQRQRAVTRVGCKAMIMVKRIDHGRWAVTKFVKDHNHGPVAPRKVEYQLVTKDGHEPISAAISLVPEGHPVQEPFEGMEFDSEEAAKDYYGAYAMQTGFRARISKYCRSRRDNSIISRQIVCSKEGFREMRMKKEMEDDGRIKRPRVITRIGCKAMMVVKKLTSGKWIISKFEREHNHALISSKNVPPLQAHSSDEKSSITKLKEASAGSNGTTMAGSSGGAHGTSRESLTIMYNQLCYEAIRYAQEGATTLETYNVAIAALREAVEKVAAAKRGALTVVPPRLLVTGTNQRVALGQGSGSFMIPAKAFHEVQCPGEARQNIAGQEVVLLQQPVSFVLVPCTPANNSTSSAESPVILNVTNGQILHIAPSDAANMACSSQGMHTSVQFSGIERSIIHEAASTGVSAGNGSAASDVPAARKRDLPCTDGHAEHNSLQKSQKLEPVRLGQASACTNFSAGVSEEQMVTIPALPVTLYMPVMGSLSESHSVTTSGTPGGSYSLLTSPVEARAVPVHPSEADAQSHAGMQQPAASQSVTQTPTPPDQLKSYTGPNPQVHATALAAGARIVPPKAAASLIKALETRIRSARALVKSPSAGSCKLLDAEACSPRPCDSEEGSQVGASSDDPRLCRTEEAMKESDMGTSHSVVMNPG